MKFLLPLAVLAVALVAADNKPADKTDDKPVEKKTDKELIQGTWDLTALEEDGRDVKDGPTFDNLKGMKLTFKDTAVSNSKVPDDKATFTLDPDKKPAELDIVVKDKDGKEKEKVPMLYELKGDTLRLCAVPMPNAQRAKEFNSKNGQLVLTFKREEKKDK